MSSIEDAKNKMQSLYSASKFEKMVTISALLTKLLEEKYGIYPIIVGGLAVEIYTRSDYSTVDIDLIISDRKLTGILLSELGFEQEGRHWFHEELMVSIEIPHDMLEGADYNKIVELQLPDYLKVYVIGIEDIILDRLRACVHWTSSSDCEWGQRMLLLHFDKLDIEYMRNVSIIDNTSEKLEIWINDYYKKGTQA